MSQYYGKTEQVYTAQWFARVFASGRYRLEVNEEGLRYAGSDETWTLPWDAVTTPPAVRRGILFATLTLASATGNKRMRWLPRWRSHAITQHLQQGWYSHHAKAAQRAVDNISQLLSPPRYLRESLQRTINAMARNVFGGEPVLPQAGVIPRTLETPFIELNKWAQLDEHDAKRLNSSFVQSQLEDFAELLDTVESQPLTARQREACVVDEDNNLVLAGAGSGKTSVMVGRAAYLLQSGQAEPHQILMLAFGNKAAQEMRERIEAKLNVTGIVARTFHSFGQDIITAVENGKPGLSAMAEDDNLLNKYVDTWFEQLLTEPDYRAMAVSYFSKHLYCEKNAFDFNTLGDYYAYLEANDVRTLKGEKVKGFGECHIANWLFKMGIEYEYETQYNEENTRTPEFRAYRPDFYLPDHGIYIEHFGVDRHGGTAPCVDRTRYTEGMQWKRALHERNATTLVETFYYEHAEGTLLEDLADRLQAQGVEFEPLPEKALLDTLREFGAVGEFAALLAQFLRRFKANFFDEARLADQISQAASPAQTSAALELLKPIVKRYEQELSRTDSIDFDDMIGRAIEYVESGRYSSHYKFILVDEFQDISEPRARLLRAARSTSADCSLFCVGDDWQSIYRFAGADISMTVNFANYFGKTRETALDQTFRFNDSISSVATRFVTQNPSQLVKEISARPRQGPPAVRLLRRDSDLQGIVEACGEIVNEAGETQVSLDILARYWFLLPEKQDLQELKDRFPSLSIRTRSIHASKGLESDYVALVGLRKGKHGLPSEKVTHPLLEAMLPPPEPMAHAEERRLFYVALTRAKEEAWLVADMGNASEFVSELVENQYGIDLDDPAMPAEQLDAMERRCTVCSTGALVRRESRHGGFYGCSNYPRCVHAENGCTSCGRLMRLGDGFKHCIACEDSTVPLCPQCGAELRLRNGRWGKFWGCSNYRRGNDASCAYTIGVKKLEVPHPNRASASNARI